MKNGEYIPLSTRIQSYVVGISAEKLDAWFKAVPGLREWDSYALKNKLNAYRQHQVTPAFVAEITSAAIATFRSGNHANLDTDTIITLHVLHREGVPVEYLLPLMAAGATPEDVSRFWGDGVELEYALSLLGR